LIEVFKTSFTASIFTAFLHCEPHLLLMAANMTFFPKLLFFQGICTSFVIFAQQKQGEWGEERLPSPFSPAFITLSSPSSFSHTRRRELYMEAKYFAPFPLDKIRYVAGEGTEFCGRINAFSA